jgi:hypothetical protein
MVQPQHAEIDQPASGDDLRREEMTAARHLLFAEKAFWRPCGAGNVGMV